MPLIGTSPFDGKTWAPQCRISTTDALAEEFIVDPTLMPIGVDPNYPTTDEIVISKGRVLAVRADTTTYTGKTVLTVADGVSNKPMGYTQSNILRQFPDRFQKNPVLNRHEFIEVPYVAALNGAYGTLSGGDRLTAYYGSTQYRNGTAGFVPGQVGALCKWVEKKVYYAVSATASANVNLASANLPAFTPRVIFAVNATGGAVSLSGQTVTWNSTANNWVANFGSAAAYVVYDFGQNAEQIVGAAVRIEPITAGHHLPGWLEWVTENYNAWEYPPMAMRVPTTDVVNEVPTTVTAGVQYRLANKPVAMWKTITVTVTGTVTALDGTVTTLTGAPLSRAAVPFGDYTLGEYYDVNPLTGDLYIKGNVSLTGITVSYSYETSYRYGRLFNSGIQGLTDGVYSGVPGTPANLEVSGVVGSLRAIIE